MHLNMTGPLNTMKLSLLNILNRTYTSNTYQDSTATLPNLKLTAKCIVKQEYLFIIQLHIPNPPMDSHQVMMDDDNYIKFWTIKIIM